MDCECSGIQTLDWKDAMNNTTVSTREWWSLSFQAADRQWLEIISSFTAKSMTFSKDIFPALQGLAKMMPASMGPYVAGLWTNTLLNNLTWYLPYSGALERPEMWRAPSWSWASTSGYVSWPYKDHRTATVDFNTCIELVDVKVSPLGEDAMGEISSAELVIKGRTLLGRIYYDEPETWVGLLSRVRFEEDCFIFHSESLDEVRKERQLPGSALAWDYPITWEGPNHVPSGSNVHVLQIQEEHREKTHDQCTSFWLILRTKDLGDNSCIYERIGLLTLYDMAAGDERKQEDGHNEPTPNLPAEGPLDDGSFEDDTLEGDRPEDRTIIGHLILRSAPMDPVLRAIEDSPPRQITIT
jgi:hypothetical protein